MNRFIVVHRRAPGFSLLEVLIAVVVLSVGLLALAALQGNMTRSSADAKVRGRVAAMLSARMDALRSSGYGNLTPLGPQPAITSVRGVDTCGDTTNDWLDCARDQAGLGSITVAQNITVWAGVGGFTAFTTEQDPAIPQFKRVTLTSTWTDAAGVAHNQSLSSDVSSMTLTSNILVPPDPVSITAGGPIVRTTSPAATAGVLPIALGTTNNDSATTNPIPELIGQSNNQTIVGTRFSVLNYQSAGSGSVIIQKRFDNEVVKCKCKYGAGGNNLPVIYRTAMWPAVWTGDAYEVATPTGNPAAPGQSLDSGPKNGVDQSALCQECCRDHHDTGANGAVRFDPERSGTGKYDVNNAGVLVPVANQNNSDYVDSCRMIRIDGFWRTASDLYERQYGLLETQAVSNVAAKSGLPTPTAVTNYTNYVKAFLRQYNGQSATPATDGQAAFNAYLPSFDAATIVIPTASNTDYRYLHGRGLYVDYLEQKARQKLIDVLGDNGPQGRCPTGTNAEDCVMPYLPFTTANLTEIAEWRAFDPAIITVNSGNLLSTNSQQPSGGRTIGKANGTTNNLTQMRRSNSGVAVNSTLTNIKGVDPADNGDPIVGDPDAVLLTDSQSFQVGGGNGPSFDVRVSGGGSNPFVFFTLGVDNNVECLRPVGADNHCVTTTGTVLPQPGTVTASNYWIETTTLVSYSNVTCGNKTVTDSYATPTFRNFVVTAATVNGVPGVIGAATNDGKKTESTPINFTSIAQGALVIVTLTEQSGSPQLATIASCTAAGSKFKSITWNTPWTAP